jgi:hypothetical protein
MAPPPGVSPQIGVEVSTLRVRGRGVQASLSKRLSVVYRREPPCDPKTLGVRLDQRREIDAWRRSREVKEALPQRVSVLDLGRTCNALFLHEIEALLNISCTF